MTTDPHPAPHRPGTPFPRRWLWYIALKLAVVGAAAALALKHYGLW